jgi:hypothetical protein
MKKMEAKMKLRTFQNLFRGKDVLKLIFQLIFLFKLMGFF